MGALIVAEAINGTRAAQVIKALDLPSGIRIHSRVPRGGQKRWTGIVAHLLRRAPEELRIHFCQQFFVISNRLRFAWNLQVEWPENIDEERAAALVAQLLNEGAKVLPAARPAQLEKVRLNAPPNRNEPEGPHNPLAPGPRSGGRRQKGAHISKVKE